MSRATKHADFCGWPPYDCDCGAESAVKVGIADVREWLKQLVPAASTFVLRRVADVSGVSGTGIVADGCHFPDGKVVTRWRGGSTGVAQTCVWDNLHHVRRVHGHNGSTVIELVPYGALVKMLVAVDETAESLPDKHKRTVRAAMAEVLRDHLEYERMLNRVAAEPGSSS